MPASASAYTGASPKVSSATTKMANPTTRQRRAPQHVAAVTVTTAPVIAPTP